jgi:type 1 glutamine amidotransferase
MWGIAPRPPSAAAVFFSALGHKAETYVEPLHLKLIDGAIGWASRGCR